jgi:hypothetical protein
MYRYSELRHGLAATHPPEKMVKIRIDSMKRGLRPKISLVLATITITPIDES